MTKQIKDKQKLKIFISRTLPNENGSFLRDIIFGADTILPENKKLKEIILKHFPEENLNSEFMKI